MKFVLQAIVSAIFHPVAFILALANIAGRDDLDGAAKLTWGIVSFIWGVGPILYITAGRGKLW